MKAIRLHSFLAWLGLFCEQVHIFLVFTITALAHLSHVTVCKTLTHALVAFYLRESRNVEINLFRHIPRHVNLHM